jgi:hypothetical protein
MVKTIVHPTTGMTVRLGCKPPPHAPTLTFKDFLTTPSYKLLWAPPAFTLVPNALPALNQTYLNDTYGDCVPAGQAHNIGIFTGNANGGNPFLFTAPQIEAIYTGMSGGEFNPNDPSTDQGCDPETALSWQMANGMLPDGSHKIAGFVGVDAANQEEIQAAAYVLEGVGLALNLPDEYINPFPSESGFVWDVAGPPDPDNGHWIVGAGYSNAGLLVATWGMVGTLAWPAVVKYCMPAAGGMLYASISHDQLSRLKKKTPIGFEWGRIEEVFGVIGGGTGGVGQNVV